MIELARCSHCSGDSSVLINAWAVYSRRRPPETTARMTNTVSARAAIWAARASGNSNSSSIAKMTDLSSRQPLGPSFQGRRYQRGQ